METPPRFDRVCSILQPTQTVSASGGPLESFSAVKTTWCRREDNSGKEVREASSKRAMSDAVFSIRYLAYPALTTQNRVQCESRTYEINALTEYGRRQFWRIFATEIEGQV